MYHYTFDHTIGGDFRIDPKRYKIEREVLIHLLAKVEEWNKTTLEGGATTEPFADEASDLRNMISWREERLNDASNSVFMEGLSIGSLRYIKAALLYWINVKEAERERQSSHWPASVTNAVRASIQPYRRHSDSIPYPPCDLYSELGLDIIATDSAQVAWDVFICHASEDKEAFVRPFAQVLSKAGLRVWFDENTLSLGDSLRRSIDRGLARSRYGIVGLSPAFFRKHWPQRELDGLVSLEVNGRKVVLPLWHNIDAAGVREYSPTLAGLFAESTSRPMEHLVASVLSVVKPQN